MTGNPTGGEEHREALKLHQGQIVMDFRTIQGFCLVLLTNKLCCFHNKHQMPFLQS